MWKNLLNLNFKIGLKDAKQSILSYEDAVKRVPDVDLARLKKAFRKDAISEQLPKQVFINHVLGEAVPYKLAEAMYCAFGGGPRGITFKDLLTGMVLLSCGSQDEKLDFLFHLFSGGNSSMPMSDLISMIKTSEDGKIPEHVVHAFGRVEQIQASQFRSWISQYWNSMALTRWLLENDFKPELISEPGRDEIPTFYQTLAGVTHLEEKEIFDLEKFYWSLKSLSSNGRFDVSLFANLLSPPVPSAILVNLFQAFDENGDGHLDLKEVVCGVSACSRGPLTERQKFCFKVFDIRRAKRLTLDEIVNMLRILLGVDDLSALEEDEDYLTVTAQDVLEFYSEDEDHKFLTLDGFLLWSHKTNLCAKFMRLLFQVCHVVLGLKPQHKEDELSSIIEWLQRDHRRKKAAGDVYLIINMEWWRNWRRYVEEMTASTDTIGDADSTTNGRKRSNGFNLSELVKLPHSRQASRSNTPTLSRSSSTISVQSRHPGPINNLPLLLPDNGKLKSLTDEGGVLKRRPDGKQLRENEDYLLICESVWKVLNQWYGGGPELPRQCIQMEDGDVDVDVFPVCLKLLRHKTTENARPYNAYPYSGMVGGFNAVGSHAFNSIPNSNRSIVERIVFATGCFSNYSRFADIHDCVCRKLRLQQDDARLWVYVDENNMTLIEDESVTVRKLALRDFDQLLVEIRNKDLTWPEELDSLAHSHSVNKRPPFVSRSGSISREDGSYEKGCCGLNNLGNTCFMNSAVQCVSYSRPLTYYFKMGKFGGEINRNNPIGFGGVVAERYAELIGQLWSGKFRTLAPLKLRMAIGKHRPAFNGFQQHDSQELLAFLLDGLHEDLNRVHEKPYVELNDSEGRLDEVVAQEAWENHLRRNQSIVVDLFHGLLKSRVKCLTCTNSSVRFDPFSVLSLPLPIDNLIFLELQLVRCDGQGPVKYGLRIEPDCSFQAIRETFSKVCGLPAEEIVPLEVFNGLVKRELGMSEKLQSTTIEGRLLMYQVPSPVHSTPLDLATRDAPRWLVALHRRMVHNESYYLAWAKATPKTFGIPVMLACDTKTTHAELYENVWQQIKRFIGPDSSSLEDSNHAQECDAHASGYSFMLKLVRDDGCWCSKCHWYRFCRGCALPVSEELFDFASGTLVIDWEPTFYHLRYQDSLEFMVLEHESVRRARLEHSEPISLDSCLKAFTHEEELGPDALYQCSKCHKPQLASKRMQLWKVPPMLALHFKRFQKVREHWVKSHKVVTFPINDLDLSSYLAAADAPMTPVTPAEVEAESEAVSCATEGVVLSEFIAQGDHDICASMSRLTCVSPRDQQDDKETRLRGSGDAESAASSACNGSLISQSTTSGSTSSLTDISSLPDTHQHHLQEGLDLRDLKYDLYAICCHSGLLATGHYVAYCKNPNGKWYLFNDSSCKEIVESQIDTSTAYMLFYERRGLNYNAYLPVVNPVTRVSSDSDFVDSPDTQQRATFRDSSLQTDEEKKYCSLQ